MSEIKVDSIIGTTGTKPPANLLPITASAWVNFDGSGVVSIRDQQNVASIIDNGVGNYTVNFTNALADANYAIASSSEREQTRSTVGGLTTSDFTVNTENSSGTAQDASRIFSIVFGGQ